MYYLHLKIPGSSVF